jgi:hypothetical protein
VAFSKSPRELALKIAMESCAVSDHNLQFKGPGFDFNAKGWQAIVAAVIIVGMIVWLWR